MNIQLLDQTHADRFQDIRLRGLAEQPTAFASSYEEERRRSPDEVAQRLSPTPGRFVLGAFDNETLVGVVGVLREQKIKRAHKAFLWGMYVDEAWRGRGIGRELLQHALDRSRAMPGLRQVYLGVIATNTSARELYLSLGFVEYGREPAYIVVDGESHDEILMVCVFPPTATE